MQLNLVYGRSGTGKSEYVYKDIASKIGTKKIFLVVPEQCNLSAEKKLFEISGRQSLIDVEILTLSRMAHRVSQEVGDSKNHISKAGKDMLIYDLITKHKDSLNFLGKSDKNIDVVNRMFTEFKKHSVSTETLNNIKLENEYTNLKLKDIAMLYSEYEAKLSNNFIDENDALTILAKDLDKTDMFNDSLIYIDEFLGFTPQEYAVFEKLIVKADCITAAICIDKLCDKL